jgi:hypothetical protein
MILGFMYYVCKRYKSLAHPVIHTPTSWVCLKYAMRDRVEVGHQREKEQQLERQLLLQLKFEDVRERKGAPRHCTGTID